MSTPAVMTDFAPKISDAPEFKNYAGKRVLITGGLGFIGSNTAQALVPLGAKVTIVDAELPEFGANRANIAEIANQVTVVHGDIRDRAVMEPLIRDAEIIFDYAGQIGHQISMERPFDDLDINLRGPLTMLEIARESGHKPRFVYASTRGAIGKLITNPIDETHPTYPTDLNGVHQLAAEHYYRVYHQAYGIPTTVLRVNNTYGPRGQVHHDDYQVVNYFTRQMVLNEPITIHGEGTQTRDYNEVSDVVDVFLRAGIKDEAVGELFMLGSSTETRLIDFIQKIFEFGGKPFHVNKIPRPGLRAAIEIGNFVVSIDKAKRLLGWEPRVKLDDGIRRMVEFYQERINSYQ